VAESGTTDEVKIDNGLELGVVEAFQPALLMPENAERESVLPGLAYDRVYVTVLVLVDVDVVVNSGPTKVYSVDVYVGKVTYSTESVVDSSVARPVEAGGVTKIEVVFVTSDALPGGETPLIQWVLPAGSTV
jgi:hypothetical protein